MATEPLRALEKFQALLRDVLFITALEENSAQSLPPDCKAVLAALVSKFIPDTIENPPRKRTKTAREGRQSADKGERLGPKSPFTTLLRLQELKLSPAIQMHLDTNNTDARSFFYTKELSNRIQSYDADSTGEALIVQYQYTRTLALRIGLDSVRWHFLMLMWHDLVRLARPECTGNRIGHLMKKHLIELIEPVYADSSDMNALGMEAVAAELHKWCAYGAKLNILVEQFGESCIFYLQDVLSPNFLSDRMRASGNYCEEAMKHLEENLQMRQVLNRNPAVTMLGRNIRSHLIQPFEQSKASQTARPLSQVSKEGYQAGLWDQPF